MSVLSYLSPPETVARAWLSGFGLGYIPIAPATWGTLPAVPIAWMLSHLPTWEAVVILIGLSGLTLLSHRRLKPLPDPDPRWFVADEMLAFILIGLLYPLPSLMHLCLAFILFRFWDIVKLWPADVLETLPEPWGILADDTIAALYTWGCLLLIGL